MPLTRKFSKLFGTSNDSRVNQSTPQPVPVPVTVAAPPPTTSFYALPNSGLNPVAAASTLSTLNEDEENERVIILTSLKEENSRLEARALEHSQELTRHEEDEIRQVQEISFLTNLVNSKTNENVALQERLLCIQGEMARLNTQWENAHTQLQASQTQHLRTENENLSLRQRIQELQTSNKQKEDGYRVLQETHLEQSFKLKVLEKQLIHGDEPGSGNLTDSGSDSSDGRRIRDIELNLRTEIEAKARRIEHLEKSLADSQRTTDSRNGAVSELQNRIATVDVELEQEQTKNKDMLGMIEALQVDRESMAQEIETMRSRQTKLISIFGQGLTPRLILTLLADNRFPRLNPEDSLSQSQFLQTYRIEDLEPAYLDVLLSQRSQLLSFCDSVSSGSSALASLGDLSFAECPKCKKSKIRNTKTRRGFLTLINRRSKGKLDEFPSRFRHFVCNKMSLCSTCFGDALTESVTNNWWYDIGSSNWLTCPIRNCERRVEVRNENDVENILKDLTGTQLQSLKSAFKKALKLRAALARCDPLPGPDELSVAASLHKQLAAYGYFPDLFAESEIVQSPEGNGQAIEFEPGDVLMGRIDRGNLTIPIFTKLFKRSSTSKDCTICIESFQEVEVDSPRWALACEGFEGPWMTKILHFPTSDLQYCEHSLDVCKECLGTHLDTQLTANARNPVGTLKCPECRRVFDTAEIRTLASEDTVQKFDRCLLLQHLANESGFRWCLRTGCDNGDVHEEQEYMDPHIRCSVCEFEMCFTHQMPWHEGMSCDQYDSQRAHGDPEHEQTEEWLRSNTKNCPGCGVSIQKGEACFHMTCSTCRHEFCWICLADYNLICPRPGDYVQTAHNAGCIFLTNGLQPTQVRGTNIDEALRRRR